MESDFALATSVAAQAGKLLLELRDSYGDFDPSDKGTVKRLRDEADRAAHELIVAAIAAGRPQDAILSEEGFDELARDTADRVWIVDPLDGTWEYGQRRHDFAVHIALWDRAAPSAEKLLLGVVDLPAQGIARTTGDIDVVPPPIPNDRPVRLVVSRSRPPEISKIGVDQLARALAEAGVTDQGVEVVNVGSVGAKVAELLGGRGEAYVHDTGFYEWDVAAPLAVAQHYGMIATHIDGAAITFNHRPPWVTNLAVSSPALAPFLIADIHKGT